MLARTVGQVRDILRCITDETDLTEPYATIAAALGALRGALPAEMPATPGTAR